MQRAVDLRSRLLRLRGLIAVAVALVVVPGASTLGEPVARAAPDGEATTKEPTSKVPDPPPSTPPSTTAPPPLTAPTVATGAPPPTGGPKPTGQPSASLSASASASASEEPLPAPSAAPSVSATVKAPKVARKFAIGVGDLSATLQIPNDWPELAADALPVVEPDPQKDSEVVSKKGYGVHDPKGKPPAVHEIVMVCGKATGEFWADAIRDAAFTQMVAATEKEIAKYAALKSIEPDPIKEDGPRILQPFSAKAEFGGEKPKPKGAKTAVPMVELHGLSLIGFTEETKGKTTLVACSIACAELLAPGETGVCASIVGSFEAQGSFAPPPKRSWLAELLYKLRKDPTTMWLVIVGGVFGLLTIVALVIVLVRRRKRPHTTETGEHEAWADEPMGPDPDAVAAELRALVASPPPREGFYDPETLTRRKV